MRTINPRWHPSRSIFVFATRCRDSRPTKLLLSSLLVMAHYSTITVRVPYLLDSLKAIVDLFDYVNSRSQETRIFIRCRAGLYNIDGRSVCSPFAHNAPSCSRISLKSEAHQFDVYAHYDWRTRNPFVFLGYSHQRSKLG